MKTITYRPKGVKTYIVVAAVILILNLVIFIFYSSPTIAGGERGVLDSPSVWQSVRPSS